MKRNSIIIVVTMLLILSSCAKSNPSDSITSHKPDSDMPDTTFTYVEYIPAPGEGIIFNPKSAIKENHIVYYQNNDETIRYGFMDLEFNKVTKAISMNEPYFYNGLVCVITRDLVLNDIVYNVFDKDLTLLSIDGKNPFMYDDIWLSRENMTVTGWTIGARGERKMNQYSIFTDSKFGAIDIYDTLIPVKSGNGFYGYKSFANVYINGVSGDDKYQIPPIFERADYFSEGLAAVRVDGKYGYINTEGKYAIPCQYSGAKEFSNGIAQVEKTKEGTNFENIVWSIIDTEGYAVSESEYAIIREYREGFASAGKYSTLNGGVLLDENGKEHFADKFRVAWGFIDGISLVQDAYGKYSYIDTNGYNINGQSYKDAKEFSDGLAVVQIGSKYGYIGKEGLVQIEPIYEYATSFNSGFAVVKLPGESLSYVIDRMGNKYLEDINLHGLSQFTEEGYALGYSEVDDKGSKIYYVIYMDSSS